MEGVWLVVLVLALFALRQPVMVMLGLAALFAYMVWNDGDPKYVVYDIWQAVNKEVLLAIPLFMLAGAIMSRGSIADRLIAFLRALTRPVPGGLALATVLACAGFAAISGSAAVTLLAVGSIMYKALLEAGYDKGFAIGALCAGGVLGIIIPPSIPLILYGVMTDTSIADLFIAGLGPAIVLVALFGAYALTRNWSRHEGSWSFSEIVRTFRRAAFALPLPIIILGGIYAGFFTPTEAAAVAVAVAVLVEVLIHRDLGLSELKDVTLETSRLLGGLFPVLLFAISLNIFLTYEQTPQNFVAAMEQTIDSKLQFLLMANILLLVVGMVIDIGSAVLILSPLLTPLAQSYGIDPVHFGIIMIVNLGVGYLTPPLGLNIIVAMAAFRESFWTISKAVAPFILLMLAGLILIAALPQVALFLVG
ncbi:MAG: TRAP transporter large permease [Pseudomonadota bacterium]